MSDSQPQDLRTGAWQNCDGHSEPRDIHAAENVTLPDWWCGWGLRVLFFGLDFVFQTPFCRELVDPGFGQRETHGAKQEKASEKPKTLSPAEKPWLAAPGDGN